MKVIISDEDLEELILYGTNKGKYKKYAKDKKFVIKLPRLATSPGTILKYELEERNISQKAFAEMIHVQKSHLNEVLSGKRALNSEMADKIEQALGLSSVTLLNLQNQYEYECRMIAQKDEEEQRATKALIKFNEIFDVQILFKRLHKNFHSVKEQIDYLKENLSLPEADELQLEVSGMFRKSAKTGMDPRMLMTWKVLAEAICKEQRVEGHFDVQKQEELLEELKFVLHQNDNTISRVKEILSRYGIAFCIVEKVDKASVDGYSFIEDGTPYVILTKRYDRIDNFAFSLLHEIGHIFLHYTQGEVVESHINISDYDNESKQEIEANKFAANMLIPDREWQKAPKVIMVPKYIQNVYSSWAEENNYNKWIVLGRIAYETGMYKFKIDDSRKIH